MVNNRSIIILLLALIFVICVFSVESYAGTCWNGGSSGTAPWDVLDGSGGNPSGAYADVEYCNNDVAGGGEIINIPAGDWTWDSTLTISVSNKLMGAGTTNTIIRRGSASPLIDFNPSNYNANDAFRISGIYFDFNSGGSATFKIGRSKPAPFTVQINFRIDHNVFDEMSGTGAFWNYGVAYGVIDNNRFEYNSGNYPFKNDPQVADSYDWWVYSPQHGYDLGSGQNLYWEDNIINMNGSNEVAGAECQYGGRYAFRYNTFNTNGPSYNFFEMHGHQTSGSMPSCFGAEIYGNDIIASNEDIILFKVRGGRSAVFANSGSNVSGQWAVNSYTSLITCPTADPNGQMINNSFQWMNREDYNGSLASTTGGGNIDGCGDLDNRPMLGRDMVGDNTTPGVTYGALNDRPGTCTEHQGYWVTDQDLSDLTDYVGANPAIPLSGTLYVCDDSGNWLQFYTPFPYPHPLRSGDPISPGPPLELQVIDVDN